MASVGGGGGSCTRTIDGRFGGGTRGTESAGDGTRGTKRAGDDGTRGTQSAGDDGDSSDQMGAGEPLAPWGGRDRNFINEIELLDDSKHRDGSIYTGSSFLHKLFRLNYTEETYLEPMMLSMPTDCWPDPFDCYEHLFCHMMQIYSLKLAYTSADADTSGNPILLYGFMAVRDCLNPRRNYVFRRTRDDPFVVVQDSNGSSFIRMSGPKRGIEMQSLVLVEFDMRIKIGENEEDDLQLIDGAIYFDSLVLPPDMIINRRIVGDCGAVDMSLAFLHCAAEATIQVGISNVPDGGLSLFLQAHANDIKNGIWLFDNVVSEPCELNRFVVAACRGSKLLLIVKSRPVNGTASLPISKFFIRDVRRHGSDSMTFNVHTAKIDVKVNWSTLDLPSSALREDNHYPFALDD